MNTKEHKQIKRKVITALKHAHLPDVVEDTGIPYLWLWHLTKKTHQTSYKKDRVNTLAGYFGIN